MAMAGRTSQTITFLRPSTPDLVQKASTYTTLPKGESPMYGDVRTAKHLLVQQKTDFFCLLIIYGVLSQELYSFCSLCRVISIDFKNIRVLNKTNLRVRRRGSQQTKWLWHYRGDNRWYQYGEKVCYSGGNWVVFCTYGAGGIFVMVSHLS